MILVNFRRRLRDMNIYEKTYSKHNFDNYLILLVSVGAYAARKYYNLKHAVDNTCKVRVSRRETPIQDSK